jgi:ketosteroid isomerase-like protein
MPFSGPPEDRQLICELIADYCDAVNQRNDVAWGATWDEDAVWSLPFLGIDGIRGRANIVSAWKQAMALFSFAHMMAQAGRIEVDGDRALVRCYTSEVTVAADSGTERRPSGLYEDVCVNRGGRWLFQSRTFHVLHGAA